MFKFFNNKHTCYVKPFAGEAALFFLKAPTDVEVLDDINSDLVNLYRVVQHTWGSSSASPNGRFPVARCSGGSK
ncbi:DNA adenine methylase [Frateuria edaphi]|uniref:DNA adenine methylase n=1 Tax=Frateuria edaphi TaxID=2898793 RepID=UPI001E32944A|nr:DNA adenine methylase [Frateuria edaphi]UGB47483.1 DNA adenine methylase [Frateuria edaphi]